MIKSLFKIQIKNSIYGFFYTHQVFPSFSERQRER